LAAARLPAVAALPGGLVYRDDFLTPEEERSLLGFLETLAFEEVRMHGQPAKRSVVHFGYRYDYGTFGVAPTHPLPDRLVWLRERAGALVAVAPDRFVETLVTRYPAGAGIGWHRDAPRFGPEVVGVSLRSSCSMRFQRRTPTVRETHVLELAPRSAYALTGASRRVWQHSIRATDDLRFSVTFRTLAGPEPAPTPGIAG
jgi:alkylated DNA repair protein (DNA oxidative demethylase)